MATVWNELELPESTRSSWKAPAESYGASTVIHALILGVLSFFTLIENPFSGDHTLTMNWNENSPLESLEPDPVQPQQYQPRSGGSQTTSVAFMASASEVKISVPEVRDSDARAVAEDDVSSSQLASFVGALSTFGLEGNGTGDGTGDGEGSGFFGNPGTASSFVFVLDRSGSMNARHIHSGELSRFQRLKLELIGFIDRLQPEQKFYVIFFDQKPHPMPADGLVQATEQNKQIFLKWVTGVKADGSTDPRGAIKMAMHLDPDQIYFLSDGEIMDVYRGLMLRYPIGDWKLNTYSFGQGSENFMRAFADKHHGKYTFIP